MTRGSLLEYEQTSSMPSLNRSLNCTCALAQPFALLSYNKMGMSLSEQEYGTGPWPDGLRFCDLLSPSASPLTSLETPGSVELLDVLTRSIHTPCIFVPAVFFAWDSSPYFVFKDLEQASPFGVPASPIPFSFPVSKTPIPTVSLSSS